MNSIRSRCIHVLMFALSLSFTSTALASDIFPLETGLRWAYIQTNAPAADTFYEVLGPTDFHGTTAIEVTETLSVGGESSTNSSFFVESPGGEVHLLGSRALRPDGVLLELVNQPPIVHLAATLDLSSAWVSSYAVDVYEDGTFVQTLPTRDQTSTVVAVADALSLPAGEFSAVQVRTTGGNWQDTIWLASGVGRVQYQYQSNVIGPVYRLDSYEGTVPVEPESFGSLKAVFAQP